jgi:hypothetical protein
MRRIFYGAIGLATLAGIGGLLFWAARILSDAAAVLSGGAP